MKVGLCLFILFCQLNTSFAADNHCSLIYKHLKDDRFADAITLAEQGKCPDLALFVSWKHLRFDKNEATFKDHYDFLKQHHDWPFLYQIRKNMERRSPEGIDNTNLMKWFTENPPSTPEGITTYAKLLHINSQSLKADTLIRQFWIKSLRDSDEASEFLKIHPKVLRSQDYYNRATELLWEGKTDLIEPLLQHLNPKQDHL